jgi:amino acid adenylation domain-containing protein
MELALRFRRGLDLAGDRPAIRVGDSILTYRAAHTQALQWAGALRRAVGREPVAVVAGRSITAYVGILACVYAGVPVVPLLADFPVARTREMLRSAGAAALVVDSWGARVAPSLGVPVLGDFTGRALPAPCPVLPDDIAYVLFTSGSTGRPKGVRLTHGNLAHYFGLMDAWYDFTPRDVFSQAAGLNWDSAVSDLWCAWGAGAGLVSVPTPAYRDLPGFVNANDITVWFSAPSVISLARRTGCLVPASLGGLRWSFFGGEALTCADAASWQAAAPDSAVVNVYGPTEATISTHRHTWTPDSVAVNGIVPLGRVHPGHRERLVAGELWISGPQVAAGYVDPDDAAGRFDGAWYRTGDRVRRVADGSLVYLGRMDSQVQVGGYRVELTEVDHALRGVAGVVDGVTVGAPTAGTTALVAFYTGTHVAPVTFARQLAEVLPRHMIPLRYRHLPSLPLTTNRKIDRLALTDAARELLR